MSQHVPQKPLLLLLEKARGFKRLPEAELPGQRRVQGARRRGFTRREALEPRFRLEAVVVNSRDPQLLLEEPDGRREGRLVPELAVGLQHAADVLSQLARFHRELAKTDVARAGPVDVRVGAPPEPSLDPVRLDLLDQALTRVELDVQSRPGKGIPSLLVDRVLGVVEDVALPRAEELPVQPVMLAGEVELQNQVVSPPARLVPGPVPCIVVSPPPQGQDIGLGLLRPIGVEELPCDDTVDLIDPRGKGHITLWNRTNAEEVGLTVDKPVKVASDGIVDVFVDAVEIDREKIEAALVQVNALLERDYVYEEDAAP